MDALDEHILGLLRQNSRESFATIGKEVGLSAQAVGKRVRIMEETGIIEGYSVKVNHEKLGIDIKAYITLKLGTYESFGERRQEVENLTEVQSCHLVTGDDCMIIVAHFKNNKHLSSFLEHLSRFGNTRTSIIL